MATPAAFKKDLRAALAEAYGQRIMALWFLITLLGLSVVLILAWAMEYSFFYALFDHFDQGLAQGRGIQISTSVKAMISIVCVIALHAAIARLQKRWGEDEVDQKLSVFAFFAILLFVTGAGFALSYVISTGGLLDLGSGQSLDAQVGQMLGQGVAASGAPWLVSFYKTYVLPVFPVIFSIALPVTLLITLYVAHVCMTQIIWRLRRMIECRRHARELVIHGAEVWDQNTERERLIRLGRDAEVKRDETNVADMIHAAAVPLVALLERFVAWREANPDDEEFGSELTEFKDVPPHWWDLPIDLVRARVARLKEQTSLDAIRQALEVENA